MTEKSALQILIIDDDFITLRLLIRMLIDLGFPHIATCDGGRHALERIDSSSSHPDLILLDMNMPEMDGIEFLRHLIERSYAGSLILISEDNQMFRMFEHLAHAHRIMHLGSLHKPVTQERLAVLLGK